MKNIVLVGFMGTGKTTIGGLLAGRLNMSYINTDSLIEKKEGLTINDIFGKKGEPYFRKAEREIIKEVSKKENMVIDTGGGVIINEDNIKDLKENGVIFCLNASPEEILRRTKRCAHRPLLNVDNPLSEIKKLLNKRSHYYKKADCQIDTNGRSAAEVAEEIIGIYNRQTLLTESS